MKIDAEGAEHLVLKGIRPQHWPRIRQFAVEVYDIDGRLAQVEALLKGHGFDVVREQDSSLLHDTVLNDLYARREDDRAAAGPAAAPAPAPSGGPAAPPSSTTCATACGACCRGAGAHRRQCPPKARTPRLRRRDTGEGP
ncbi:class I SAM-dependent methyltransferase [Streptomyces tendae]|uniref:hypothetical protein n=1 Tax=Streptomyces tendae TaxID=1932 RepID=UPI00116EFB1F